MSYNKRVKNNSLKQFLDTELSGLDERDQINCIKSYIAVLANELVQSTMNYCHARPIEQRPPRDTVADWK